MNINDFKECYAIAKACYPAARNHSLRKRVRFSLRLFCGYRAITENIESFFAGTDLRRFIMSLPEFREQIYIQQVRPSFYRDSLSAHRSLFLLSHFKLLEKTHKEEVIRKIYGQCLNPIVVNEQGVALSFSIGYAPGILKEGLLQLSITVNNITLYRVVFWLMNYHGTPTLCISALQGGRDTLEDNQAFTKQFWGLRPQNMALTVLRCYAKAVGIEQIYTFSKDNLLCKKISSQTNLDQFWHEQGAVAVAHTPFLKLELDVPRRALSEIATRKRSAYRKRYEFLDRFQATLAAQFELYVERSIVTADSTAKASSQNRTTLQKQFGRRGQRRLQQRDAAGVPLSAS